MIARLRPALVAFVPLIMLILLMLGLRLAYSGDSVDTPPLQDAFGRTFNPSEPGLIASTTALGFLLIGAWLTGILFKRLHLPRVSGYLIFGVLAGPHFFGALGTTLPPLVPQAQLDSLKLISSLAIAFIALTAGGEIRVEFLREGFKRIATITVVEILIVFTGMTAAFLLGHQFIDFIRDEPMMTIVMIALVVGALEVANSPAVVIAILGETRARGPMAESALAITIFKDLLLIILFTIVISIAVNVLDTGEAVTQRGVGDIVIYLVVHLIGSILAGGILGVVLSFVGRHLTEHISLFVVATALGIALVSDALGLESLLVALAAGFTMVNLWPERTAHFFHSIERLALPVYCVFFAAAGAKIDLNAVAVFWPIALGLVAVRASLIYTGTNLGCRASGLEPPARNWLWTALIPQAGVTIALIASIERSFSIYDWSVPLMSVLLAMVAIHELLGPVLFRFGLQRAGEIADAPR